MKKAFGAAAKKMLGPVGVAIANISFGICLHEASLDKILHYVLLYYFTTIHFWFN